jgi:FkbM family methyltransferase
VNSGVLALSEALRKLGKASRLLGNAKFRHGLQYGVAAAIEHKHLLSRLNLRTVVDIGANIGQFSLLSRALFPTARIYAFEPQMKAALRFSQLFRDDALITLFYSAIGTQSGQIEMHVSRRHDCSSLLPISPVMTDVFPGTDEIGLIDVPIAPLIKFLSAEQIADPALLKIDVQGTELDVLRACEPLLSGFRYVYIELSFVELYVGQALCGEIIRFLDQKNFHVVGVKNLREDGIGRTVQADFLFRSTP